MKRVLVFLAALALAGCLVAVATARVEPVVTPRADYVLSRWTIDGGGSALANGGYTLIGTAGQPDAALLDSGAYSLGGGFWGGGAKRYGTYLPLVLRDQ